MSEEATCPEFHRCKYCEKQLDVDHGYNGWPNYETWNVALWYGNDEGSYHHSREMARGAWDGAEGDEIASKSVMARRNLADLLKEEVEANAPTADDANLYADLMDAALGDVNWLYIANHWLEDFTDEESGYEPWD